MTTLTIPRWLDVATSASLYIGLAGLSAVLFGLACPPGTFGYIYWLIWSVAAVGGYLTLVVCLITRRVYALRRV